MDIKVIAFDADDTLWVNEPYYQETEKKFCMLLEDYMPYHNLSKELFATEMQNLSLYGFGVKSFILSMIESALRISDKTLPIVVIEKIIQFGKDLINKEIEILQGVEEVLKAVSGKYKLVVATKGDLLDQERKLTNSGIEHYFHHIEIMSDKKESDYQKLIKHLDIKPDQFMMIGNSLKSDILPVLSLGGYGVHIPYHTTWAHEQIESKVEHANFIHIDKITDIIPYLKS